MLQTIKKAVSIVVGIFTLLLMIVPSYAAFTDTSESWASAEIEKWASKGVILGDTDGTFKPDNPISRAEFVTIINRVLGLAQEAGPSFIDVSARAWYSSEVAKAFAAGLIKGDDKGMFRPNDPITRQEAAVIFCRAFNLEAANTNAAAAFADGGEIAQWSMGALSALVEKNYISGRPGRILAPKDNITRAETVKLIDNIAGELKNSAGTYTGEIPKNLVVNTASVTLKDMVVNGDLYLAQGIGEGTVTLDNVTVKGRTIVKGGGENSIILNNSKLEGSLVIIKKDGKVRIVASGSTEVEEILLNSGAKLEERDLTGNGFGAVEVITVAAGQSVVLDGDFEEVVVEAGGVEIEVTSGTITQLKVDENAAGVSLNLAKNAKVGTLVVNAAAEVKGEGTIQKAVINASGVTIEQEPEEIEVAEGITAEVGGETVTGGEEPSAPSGGGGGGGGDDDDEGPSITVSNIAVTMKTGSANPGGTNVSGNSSSDRITGITFTANITSGTLSITSIESENLGTVQLERDIAINSANVTISVKDLLGNLMPDDRDSISVGTMRSIFGRYVKVNGTITGTGSYANYRKYTRSITITLGDGDELPARNDWATITYDEDSKTITADIVDGKESELVLRIGITDLLTESVGVLPSYVSTDKVEWKSVADDKSGIAADIAALAGKTWDELTLGDLAGESIYFKKAGDSVTVYEIKIIDEED